MIFADGLHIVTIPSHSNENRCIVTIVRCRVGCDVNPAHPALKIVLSYVSSSNRVGQFLYYPTLTEKAIFNLSTRQNEF